MTQLSEKRYLQIAFDIPNLESVEQLLQKIQHEEKLIFELGTPLIKNEGLKNLLPLFRKYFPKNYIVADLKTLDVGKLEVELASIAGANGCVVSGLAPKETIFEFGKACEEFRLDMWIDSLGTSRNSFLQLVDKINSFLKVIIIHRGIDEELGGQKRQNRVDSSDILRIKKKNQAKIAVAGGINQDTAREVINQGADIIIIGRCIYSSQTPQKEIDNLLKILI